MASQSIAKVEELFLARNTKNSTAARVQATCMASSPSRKSDMLVGAHDSSHFFLFLSGTQSRFLSESEDGRGGTKCAQKKKKVRNSPLGKWEKKRTRENSMIIWQHERASLDPVVMNSK